MEETGKWNGKGDGSLFHFLDKKKSIKSIDNKKKVLYNNTYYNLISNNRKEALV